jgi:hypothetical protein
MSELKARAGAIIARCLSARARVRMTAREALVP